MVVEMKSKKVGSVWKMNPIKRKTKNDLKGITPGRLLLNRVTNGLLQR